MNVFLIVVICLAAPAVVGLLYLILQEAKDMATRVEELRSAISDLKMAVASEAAEVSTKLQDLTEKLEAAGLPDVDLTPEIEALRASVASIQAISEGGTVSVTPAPEPAPDSEPAPASEPVTDEASSSAPDEATLEGSVEDEPFSGGVITGDEEE